MDDAEELPDPFLGRVLAERYRVIRRLGAGGMGDVYEAEHEQIGRRVAIKVLHEKLSHDVEMLRRFKNEARAGGTLGHPNIAQTVDVGRTDEGAPFIVMELLEGEDLARVVANGGPLSVARATAIVDQLADALSTAHAAGIVHRDLKPENVFLTAGDHVKLLDFGISKFSTASRATLTGAFIGSPQFMAPEQVADASRTDARTDIYALGAVLFTIVTGRPVFMHTSLPLLVIAIGNHTPTDLTELRVEAPPELAALVARMLRKDPSERPQTMEEVRAGLRPFVASGAGVNVSTSPLVGAALSPTSESMSPVPSPVVASRIVLPSRGFVWPIVAVCVVLGGIVAVWVSLATSEPDDPGSDVPTPLIDHDVAEAPSARSTSTSTAMSSHAAPAAESAIHIEDERDVGMDDVVVTERVRPTMGTRDRAMERVQEAPDDTMRIDGVPIDDTY